MKKEEVYKLIEYNGFYDDKVKKNLKKIIKKYHPDKNKNDKKTIEIIYEVKKELENNKVSYKPKANKEKEIDKFISEEECIKNIIKLEKIERGNSKELDYLYDNLSKTFKEYHDIYRKFFLTKSQFCELDDELKRFKKIKFLKRILYIILLIFIFINIFYFNLTCLIISIIILMLIIVWSWWYSKKVKIVKHNMDIVINKIKKRSQEITIIQEKIKKLSSKIHSLERNNNNVKNNIRFYKNMKK